MVQNQRPPGTLQRWSELPPPADSFTASRRPRGAVSPPQAPRRACLCRTCSARFPSLPSPLRQMAARSRTAERATRQLAFLPPGLPAAQATLESSFPPALGTPAPEWAPLARPSRALPALVLLTKAKFLAMARHVPQVSPRCREPTRSAVLSSASKSTAR